MSEEEKNKAELQIYLSKKDQNSKELNELVDKIKPILG